MTRAVEDRVNESRYDKPVLYIRATHNSRTCTGTVNSLLNVRVFNYTFTVQLNTLVTRQKCQYLVPNPRPRASTCFLLHGFV
jgi:hypothetical protein